ncbi:hypothetical protein HBB16_10735 [Pseudonocardia sp. MCCB 268]|nr:hypothetical protein [Pseudonocardia cytotoxica]
MPFWLSDPAAGHRRGDPAARISSRRPSPGPSRRPRPGCTGGTEPPPATVRAALVRLRRRDCSTSWGLLPELRFGQTRHRPVDLLVLVLIANAVGALAMPVRPAVRRRRPAGSSSAASWS